MKVRLGKESGIFIVLLALFVALSFISPVFLTADNLIDLVRTNVVLGILAIGMTIVILIGGIDVSVGAMTAAVTVLLGYFTVAFGFQPLVALLVSIAGGTLLGLINGLLVTKIRVHAIVVTLGTLSIYSGFTMYVTGGSWINNLPAEFIEFGRIRLLGFVPIQILFLLAVALATWFMLRHLHIGRAIYALGGSPVAAERSGIDTARVQQFVYAYMGFLAGVAAFVHTSIYRQVDPNAFTGFELQVIAAVVLGGASIMGGRGSVLGSLLGVALLALIGNGLTLARISSFWHKVIIGLFIVIAVSFDIWQRKRQERRMAKIDVMG